MNPEQIYLTVFIIGFLLSLFSFLGAALRLPHFHFHGHVHGGGPAKLGAK